MVGSEGGGISGSPLGPMNESSLSVSCLESRHEWRQRFLGILPEVYKRKLHERYGYGSIFEFAFRTGGVSKAGTECYMWKKSSGINQNFMHYW